MALGIIVTLPMIDQALVTGECFRTEGTFVRKLVLVLGFTVHSQLVSGNEKGRAVLARVPFALHVHQFDVTFKIAILREGFVANVAPETQGIENNI